MMDNCTSSGNTFISCLMENWLTLSQTPASIQCNCMLDPQIEKKSVKKEKALLLLLYLWQCACEQLKKQSAVQVRQLPCYLVAWSSIRDALGLPLQWLSYPQQPADNNYRSLAPSHPSHVPQISSSSALVTCLVSEDHIDIAHNLILTSLPENK